MPAQLFLAQSLLEENFYSAMIVVAVVLFLFSAIIIVVKRYKRCPSNKVLVIYGRTTRGQSAKCLHGGGAFVWPVVQAYDYLALDPVQRDMTECCG